MRTLLLAALLAVAPLAAAADDVPAPSAPTVAAVLDALAASPDQPQAYKASVALHVRMRVFPFIRLTLHGDSWYKRPGLYRFVFRGVPLVAKAFSDMKYDLGDPARWPERYEVAFAPESTPAAPVLRLTPQAARSRSSSSTSRSTRPAAGSCARPGAATTAARSRWCRPTCPGSPATPWSRSKSRPSTCPT